MSSLLVESSCNSLATERNLELNSNIKKIIQSLIENKVELLNKVIGIKDNIFFNEKHTDILHTINNNKNGEEVLLKNNYKKTDIDNYNLETFNIEKEYKIIPYLKNSTMPIKQEFKINYKGIMVIMNWFYEDNYIVFYDLNANDNKYYYHLNENYTLLDFKIDEDEFCHFILIINNKKYYLKSSLFFPFLELNKIDNNINEKYILEKIELNSPIEEFLEKKGDILRGLTKEKEIIEITLDKKYYFELDNKLYFNHSEIYEKIKDVVIDHYIQLNNLNMYNYLSMLGLNEFETIKKMKLSSLELEKFKNIFKNRFNNTKNGGINFYNTKNLVKKSDYQININDEYFAINGNFYIENLKGKFEIIINDNKCFLYKIDEKTKIKIKEMKISNEVFYFCNLKFFYKRYENIIPKYTFTVSNLDSYPLTIKNNTIKIEKIYNDKKISNETLTNTKIIGFENSKINCYFDGKSIVFDNMFLYDKKSFLFDNHVIQVKRNEKINLSDKKEYYFNRPYIIKNNHIYFRENGEFYYCLTKEFKFQLINELGFITDFWVKNQGKTIYFKFINNKIELTENKNEAEIFCNIPNISLFINKNKKYSSVIIEDNGKFETEIEYDENMLITDKFMNKPLFNMIFIENCEKAEIFDINSKQVLNVIIENYNNGIILYFDGLDETYYYNTETSKYNYFTPQKTFENLEKIYYLNENNEINFNETKKIENFAINCDSALPINEKIVFILYNYKKGETYKIETTPNELGKNFELNLEIDSILLEDNQNLKDKKFYFKITKLNSIINNNKITYLKKKQDDPVYISNLIKEIEIVNYTKIKVNTKYQLFKNNSYKESTIEDFLIRSPFFSEIPIFKNNFFQYFSKKINCYLVNEENEFFNENFKNPGTIIKSIENNEMFRSKNNLFELDEIIDKTQGGKNE